MRKNKFVILCVVILASSILLGACSKQSNTKDESLNANLTSEIAIKDEQENKVKEDAAAVENEKKEDVKREDNNDKKEVASTVEDKKTEVKPDVKNTDVKNSTKNNTEKPKNETNKPTNTLPNTNTYVSEKPKTTEQQSKPSTQVPVTKPEPKTTPNDSINYGSAKVLPIKYNMRYNASFEDEIIRLTNELRKQHGLAPLKYDSSLRQSARYKSSAMLQLDYFSHDNPNYGGESAGYLILDVFKIQSMMVGENINNIGSSNINKITAKGCYNLWLNSPPHKENMLNKEFTKIGVGIIITKRSDGGTELFGTQHFAK